MNNTQFLKSVQVPTVAPVDYYALIFLWADSELPKLRHLKTQLKYESSPTRREELEAHLRVRVQRYTGIVSRAMSELRQDPRFLANIADGTK